MRCVTTKDKIRANTFIATVLIILPVAFLLLAPSAATVAQSKDARSAEKNTPGQHLLKAREAYEARKYSLVKDELKRALSY